jgi:hypothetical protein
MRVCIVGWVELLSVAGTKRAIVDRAANLGQEIGPSSRPAHLLGFIHSAVHQKIGRPLGDRSEAAREDRDERDRNESASSSRNSTPEVCKQTLIVIS